MEFFHQNLLAYYNFPLQFVILTTVCDSAVTYYASDDKCTGIEKLQKICARSGGRAAKIDNKERLELVRKAIDDKEEYWIGLSWDEREKQYYWDHKGERNATISPNIASQPPGKGRYCFLFKKDRPLLRGVECKPNEVHKYICEKDTLFSSKSAFVETEQVSTQLETATRTEPTLTVTSSLTTIKEPKVSYKTALQTPTMVANTTAITAKASASATTATTTTTTVSSSELITPSPASSLSANSVLSNTLLTSVMIDAKWTSVLSTAAIESSMEEASIKYKSAQGKDIAREKIQRYTAAIKALNVSDTHSLQNVTNITRDFFNGLKEENVITNEINLLLATQELESFAIEYSKIHFKGNESKVISQGHYAMKLQKVPADNKDEVGFSLYETDYLDKDDWARISIPSRVFKGKDAVVVFIMYTGIENWVPDEEYLELDDDKFTNFKLGSRIIAGRVDPEPPDILEENVTISSPYGNETRLKEELPICHFWDFSIKSKMNGLWSRKGCSLMEKDHNKITCSCNHLTNFAVMMQVGKNAKEIPEGHKVALEVISYIGCALSLTGEVLTIITHCVLMNLKQEQIQIRLNLVVAIATAQIAFLSGIDATETTSMCVFVAALIHFFYLVGFAWMLFEGIYLYLMVVKVFNTVIRMRLFYVIAWGLPVVIVVLSIGIASIQDGGIHSYVHGDFCWVAFTNNLIWTFVIPVVVVCLINTVILGLVVREIIKIQGDKTSELQRMRQGVKACVVLFPLLGMTWVFGILAVTDAGLVFQYIFTIINSVQGFFIFILHVLRNDDVRAEFDRKRQKWKTSRSIAPSCQTHQQRRNMRADKVATSGTYELQNKPNKTTSRPASGFNNLPDLYQQKYMTAIES